MAMVQLKIVPTSAGGCRICLQLACPSPAAGGRRVGYVYDAVMELHLLDEPPDDAFPHVECPQRTSTLHRMVAASGVLGRCVRLTQRQASDEELLRVHTERHVHKVDTLYTPGVTLAVDGEPAPDIGDSLLISGDIYCTEHTRVAARTAAGCATEAVKRVLAGTVNAAFAVVRPPGHHASRDSFSGFCLFNNVAVAAHEALAQGVQRVLVVDYDVHHGNGTQQVFEDDPRVLFVSLHRRDGKFYPGTGAATEVGVGAGAGFTVNVPWPKGYGDADTMAAFDLLLDPIFEQFAPELVIASAGFDAVEGDVLGGCCMSPAGFAHITERLQRFAGGRLVCVLEGGYVPSLVGQCAAEVVKVMLGDAAPPMRGHHASHLTPGAEARLRQVHKAHQPHWRLAADLPVLCAAATVAAASAAAATAHLGAACECGL